MSLGVLSLPLFILCLLVGCGSKDDTAAASIPAAAPVASSAKASPPEPWAGKWLGPEGTFLEIADAGGKARITIRNLDGPRTFDGVRQGERIVFERDGTGESIRAGSGADTGMKWLAGKSDCLVVKPGEGYCR